MAGHECYHCKRWVEDGEPHDCWTTTEHALTQHLSEDLLDAWERLRETAVEFGEQRIYASHNSIMFSRKSCYFFVRPKRSTLEVCMFLGRRLQAPQIRSSRPASKTKVVHTIHIRHRDEVEPPITDWLREAYEQSDALAAAARLKQARNKPGPSTSKDRASQRARTAPRAGKAASKKKAAAAGPRKASAGKKTSRSVKQAAPLENRRA
jgi:hypothetical protein